jgi:DNA-binding PadR family transcriptional regulator
MGSTPRMTLSTLAILSAMLDEPAGAWYGLELSRAAGLKSGTIYPALARLEQARWVESAWEEGDPAALGRPLRRMYRLTGVGSRAATQALAEHVEALTPRSRRRAGQRAMRPRPRSA